MLLTETSPHTAFSSAATDLKPGPEWASFEQFRTGGVPALESIRPGHVGTLRAKANTYRILGDRDFQSLIGLAGEVDRLQNGFMTMIHAVRVVKENPHSPSALDLLIHIATQCIGSPILPARVGHAPHVPEAVSLPEDDEVILDPAHLRDSVSKR
jgi:hypothetical protein